MTEDNPYTDEAEKVVTSDDRATYFIGAVDEGNQDKALAIAPDLGFISDSRDCSLLNALKQATKNNWDDVIEVAASNIGYYGQGLTIFSTAIENGSAESALAMVNEITLDSAGYAGILDNAAQKGMLPVIEALNNNGQFKNLRPQTYDNLIQTAMENASPEQIDRHHKAQTLYALGTAMANIRDGEVSEFFNNNVDTINSMLDYLGVDDGYLPDNATQNPSDGVAIYSY